MAFHVPDVSMVIIIIIIIINVLIYVTHCKHMLLGHFTKLKKYNMSRLIVG